MACGAANLSACSSDKERGLTSDPSGDAVSSVGTMRLALTARGASGALYRLRQATFQVAEFGGGQPPPFIPGPAPVPAPPRPPIGGDEPGTGGFAGTVGMGGGSAGGSTGIAGSGGVAGSGAGGSAGVGTGGTAGTGPIGGVTFLFSETDPLSSTLETTLRAGLYNVLLFDGWFLEKAEFGQVTVVDAQLVSSPSQDVFVAANEESFVSYRFETSDDVIDFGEGRLVIDIEVDEVRGGGGDDPRPGVMENNVDALAPFFTLEEALAAALANAGSSLSARDAYNAMIDSYTTRAQGRDPLAAHCDDETTDGAPSLNGFSLQCPRLESEQFDNLGAWFPTAVSNRLDLAPVDGAHCGQQRIIFANNSPIGAGRMFIIIEAQIPNPEPACGVSACRPLAEFWDNLSQIEDPFRRGELLRLAFFGGAPGLEQFGPFLDARNLGPRGGQIRTNNFNEFIWTLREFHFQDDVDARPLPVAVAESPNGELWNDLSTLPQGAACRESFLAAAEGLFVDNVSAMSFPVAPECQNSESRNDFSEDYPGIVQFGSGEFLAALDARGAPFGLSGIDLASRARFAGSCMGCHIEAGGLSLGNGLFAPFQNDFVHVSEFFIERCQGGQCFGISEALRNEFLPHRRQVVTNLINSPSCAGGPTEPPVGEEPQVGPAPSPGAVDGGVSPAFAAPLALPASAPRFTLGGQRASDHAH